jgi:hypothetical protein
MRVESVTVCSDRVDVIVRIESTEPLRTSQSPEAAPRALGVLPGLGSHRCHNDHGLAFSEEMPDTEVPHLFEHVVLELMAEAGSPRSLRGETSWDFSRDGRGVFRVSLEYDDDLVCLGAIKSAGRVVEYVLQGGDPPDVCAEAARLRGLRGWPEDQKP